MTTLADQTVEQMGGRLSVLTRQKADHVRLDRMLEQLPRTAGQAREDLLRRISRLVFSHAFAEEAVLWPALRRALPDGDDLTNRVEREHQEITELVAELERTPPGSHGHDELVNRTVQVLRQDVRDEEDLLLPRLQAVVDRGTLRRLGVAWEAVRHTAPTRTHPLVARRPPGNALAALPLSMIDRTRDALEHLSRRTGHRAGVLLSVSEHLGAAAQRIERIGLLQRGERPETRADRA